MTVPKWAKWGALGVELLLVGTCGYRLAHQQPTSPLAAMADLTTGDRLVIPHQYRPVTAVCRDGSTSHALHRRGTCSHHGGVESWGAPE